MRIANIIATGTEVTMGQIVNTNASWIAKNLTSHNFEVTKHFVVDDNRDRILESLKNAQSDADLIIVTGGLGPTTDDLTRQIVANWAGLELEFNETEWTRIQQRLQKLDLTPREGHKWQAYFPKGSRVFTNNAGTASGFEVVIQTSGRKTIYWFLPGPPNEVEQIWQDHINPYLLQIGPQKKTELFSWQFIDLAESELAHTVEPLVKDLELDIGYRASPPLVELKIWVPKDKIKTFENVFQQIEQALKNNLHYKNNLDPMNLFVTQIAPNTDQLFIEDHCTRAEIYNRLETLRASKDLKVPEVTYTTEYFKNKNYPLIKISSKDEMTFDLLFELNPTKSFQTLIRMQRKVSGLRQKKWVCEKVFKFLNESLLTLN